MTRLSHGHLVAHSRPHAHDDLGVDRALPPRVSPVVYSLRVADSTEQADDVGKAVHAWIVASERGQRGQATMSCIVRASWAGPPALGLTAVLDRKRIGEAGGAEVGLRVYAITFGP